jgi:hypothetical protein
VGVSTRKAVWGFAREEAGESRAFPGINSTKDLSSRISAGWKDGFIE